MVIGITGNFGSGKTTVAGMFRRLGAEVIDADRIAHQLMQPPGKVYRRLVACFGKDILSGRKPRINRKKLARIVFNDKGALDKLNAIIHPGILKIIDSRIKGSAKSETLAVDAPLLIETGLQHKVDAVVVVKAKSDVRIRRLKKSGLTADEIKNRQNFQLPQVQKLGFADFIVDNSGRRSRTGKQVRDIWNKITGGMRDGKS
ncbi:MAG: dephospho-CoA kinase [Candidatus Omnitrophota bacterium]